MLDFDILRKMLIDLVANRFKGNIGKIVAKSRIEDGSDRVIVVNPQRRYLDFELAMGRVRSHLANSIVRFQCECPLHLASGNQYFDGPFIGQMMPLARTYLLVVALDILAVPQCYHIINQFKQRERVVIMPCRQNCLQWCVESRLAPTPNPQGIAEHQGS